MERRYLKWDKNKCTTCRSCMVVCSEKHFGKGSLELARIHINYDEMGGDITCDYCRQCLKPKCVAACPEDAIRQDPNIGAWVLNESLCTGAGACVEACPFNAIRVTRGITLKCDLCGGEPACVRVCPGGALSLVTSEKGIK